MSKLLTSGNLPLLLLLDDGFEDSDPRGAEATCIDVGLVERTTQQKGQSIFLLLLFLIFAVDKRLCLQKLSSLICFFLLKK